MNLKMKFQCPKCKHKRLECCEDNDFVTSTITDLDEDGDFDYDVPIISDSTVDRFQCVNCGYVLKNEQGEYYRQS
jgi:rubredoxin